MVIFAISYHALEYRLTNSTERWWTGFYKQVYGIPSEDGDEGFKLSNYSYIALYTPKEALRKASGGFFGAAAAETKRSEEPVITGTQNQVSEDSGGKRAHHHESLMRRRQGDLLYNVAALEHGCESLKRRNISVVFITVPVHHTYYDQINVTSYQRMQETIKQITEKYGVPYFNYLRDDRFTTEDFIDSDHLNKRGAEKFSRILNEDVVKKYVRR
ncbi:MAG TPA: D-alanyl-lipoteichoic acid biosynthesis protein DltD [Pyrinomonadaceae bacterium]|nr:D-alanyl-lipoteichoic acid biosynthesis protein DltD [Pyrinomonadaceae bacterium]